MDPAGSTFDTTSPTKMGRKTRKYLGVGSAHPNSSGDWTQLSPWWRNAWKIWRIQNWQPRPHFVNINTLRSIPIWNSRLLSTHLSLNVKLHRTANGNDTKLRHIVYRALGFLTFNDFPRSENRVMTRNKQYEQVQRKLTRALRKIDRIAPRFCTAPSYHVNCLWTMAKSRWFSNFQTIETLVVPTKWTWQNGNISDCFTGFKHSISIADQTQYTSTPHFSFYQNENERGIVTLERWGRRNGMVSNNAQRSHITRSKERTSLWV